MKRIFLITVFIAGIFPYSSAENSIVELNSTTTLDIQPSKTWSVYTTYEGIKIEYKHTPCESGKYRNKMLVLLKFTNLTNQSLQLNWVTKMFYNNECSNCHRLDNPEYAHSITLSPNQVIEGDVNSEMDKSLYIFSNFIHKVDGMSDTRLTNFELIDLSVQTL